MSGSTKFITNPTVRCQSFVLEYHSISSPIWKPSRYIKLDQPNTDDDANATATTSNDTFHEFLHPTVTPRIQGSSVSPHLWHLCTMHLFTMQPCRMHLYTMPPTARELLVICVGHATWAPEGYKGRSLDAPKGLQLEVLTSRKRKNTDKYYNSHAADTPFICHFWYTIAIFRPVKSPPKKCVNLRQILLRDKTA